MERKQIEQMLALALGTLLIGVGFTMRGDLNWQLGTALAALGVVLVLASAVSMYRAWRVRRRAAMSHYPQGVIRAVTASPRSIAAGAADPSLKATLANEPLLPPGFRIHKQELRAGKNQLAPHVLWAELEIEPSIRGYLLSFRCNGPVYREACSFRQDEVGAGTIEAGPDSNSVAIKVGDRGFHSPGMLTVELASVAPLKIVRVEMAPVFRSGAMPSSRGETFAPVAPTSTKATYRTAEIARPRGEHRAKVAAPALALDEDRPSCADDPLAIATRLAELRLHHLKRRDLIRKLEGLRVTWQGKLRDMVPLDAIAPGKVAVSAWYGSGNADYFVAIGVSRVPGMELIRDREEIKISGTIKCADTKDGLLLEDASVVL